MICMYCKETSFNYEMFVVRKAIKPKGYPYRWQEIGYCCDDCESKGKPVNIPYSKPSNNPLQNKQKHLAES